MSFVCPVLVLALQQLHISASQPLSSPSSKDTETLPLKASRSVVRYDTQDRYPKPTLTLLSMAEIQLWRRRIQHRRSHPSVKDPDQEKSQAQDKTQDQDLDKADMTVAASILSKQALLSEVDERSRPMSRLASLLTVHSVPGSIDKPDPPAFDWALPNHRDKVYEPNIEAMCNTLRSRVLRYPVDDIPAQYNSFVLHLLEEYQRLLDEKNGLQKILNAEIADHEADTSKYHSMNAAWEVERKRLETQAPSHMKRETCSGLDEGYGESIPFRMRNSKGTSHTKLAHLSANRHLDQRKPGHCRHLEE